MFREILREKKGSRHSSSPLVPAVILGLLLSAGLVRGQSIIDPTVIQNATSISLTPGAQTYIYGQVTGGGLPANPLANGTGPTVMDANGNLSVGLAVSSQATNSFTTDSGYYAISGVGVSGYTDMQALYAQNVISGPGDVGPGYATMISLNFTLTEPALVVAMALGSSQQSLSFQGPSDLVTDYAASSAPLAAGIAHAYLDPGGYTIEADPSVTAYGQTLNNMADLLGVYVFTVPEPGSISLVVLGIVGLGMRRRRTT